MMVAQIRFCLFGVVLLDPAGYLRTDSALPPSWTWIGHFTPSWTTRPPARPSIKSNSHTFVTVRTSSTTTSIFISSFRTLNSTANLNCSSLKILNNPNDHKALKELWNVETRWTWLIPAPTGNPSIDEMGRHQNQIDAVMNSIPITIHYYRLLKQLISTTDVPIKVMGSHNAIDFLAVPSSRGEPR